MKNSVLILIGAVASLLGLPTAQAILAQNPAGGERGELRERDEVRQSFRLAAGARVEVSGIRGPVEVETADGDAAEVHIVRSARGRADLEQFKVGVEQGPQGLVVRGEQTVRTSRSGRNEPEVRHHVRLRLPRAVSLTVEGVSGDVRVGDIEGRLTVRSVSGSLAAGAAGGVQVGGVSGGVSVGRAVGAAEVSSVSGDVSIGEAVGSLDVSGVSGSVRAVVSRLGERGVRVSSVSGRVELRFRGELNAEFSADNVSGELSLDVPNAVVRSRPNAASLRAVVGRGGPAISINGVSQGVRLAPAS